MCRDVAIKSARVEALTEEEVKHVINEFHHEAKIAGRYAHENIVTISRSRDRHGHICGDRRRVRGPIQKDFGTPY